MVTQEDFIFPARDFTFKVLSTHFERASMVVRFTPVDTRLTAIDRNVPIDAKFDVNNLKAYLTKYAPNDMWFAQDMILQNEATLNGAEG